MKYFIPFKKSIAEIELPKKFTFPFYYEPHLLSKIAAEELQAHLLTQTEIKHSFGINTKSNEIGKMFGVLVVKNNKNELGYLTAFSGNVENQSDFKHFVPPVVDIFKKDSFYHSDKKELLQLSDKITSLENNSNFISLKEVVLMNNTKAQKIIDTEKLKLKERKKSRKLLKKNALIFTLELQKEIELKSLHDKFYLKELICYYQNKFINQQDELNLLQTQIRTLKEERNTKSNVLLKKIFDQYYFLNSIGKPKSLNHIFKELDLVTPAGTGDCAAPKLLQYAFLHDLKPIALAEFWWGKSGNSKIRKHQNFYPSCKGKCEPILSHMLEGMELDENPLLINLAATKKIDILFEDECMLVINKPTELLSVPGKNITDSVYSRLAEIYPDAKDFLIVHRLDMSTSGIMLIAKTKKANKFLQSQFIDRTILKKYIALLDGTITENSGEINLPLRVDLNDRPRQVVCFEHGKKALTKWNVLHRSNNKTQIEFTPITGRTHQLRVHAAHILGLNTAIIGDDLYGKKADRLHLHAAYIQFFHPLSKKIMEFSLDVGF